MLKRYFLYTIVSLIVLICFIFFKKDVSFSKGKDFHIEDTSLITKVFLADRNGNTITLEKNKNNWMINNEFIARQDAINMLLSTSNKIRIKKPVSKAAFDNVIKFIATTGVLVEFFQDDKMVMSYIIGSNTPDHLGTYMILRDSKEPFVVHIPYLNGFLSPRYGIQANLIDVMKWRSNLVFNLSLEQIERIKYTDFLNESNSYELQKNPLELVNSKQEPQDIDEKKVFKLLNSFNNLNCETFKKDKKKVSLNRKLQELIVNSDTLRVYEISDKRITSKENNFTVERKYATLNNGDLMLIQDYVFNKVLINISELTK